MPARGIVRDSSQGLGYVIGAINDAALPLAAYPRRPSGAQGPQ